MAGQGRASHHFPPLIVRCCRADLVCPRALSPLPFLLHARLLYATLLCSSLHAACPPIRLLEKPGVSLCLPLVPPESTYTTTTRETSSPSPTRARKPAKQSECCGRSRVNQPVCARHRASWCEKSSARLSLVRPRTRNCSFWLVWASRTIPNPPTRPPLPPPVEDTPLHYTFHHQNFFQKAFTPARVS